MLQGPRIDLFEGGEVEEDDFPEETNWRQSVLPKIFCVGLTIIVILLATALIYIFAKFPFIEHCQYSDSDVIEPGDVNNPDVFDALTMAEYTVVHEFLMSKTEFNLSRFEVASVTSNYVYMIELCLPEKISTLNYLDVGDQKPPRAAKVTIVFGNNTSPPVKQYFVQFTGTTHDNLTITPMIEPGSTTIPLPNIDKPLDQINSRHLFSRLVLDATEALYPVLMRKYNLCYHNCTKGVNCLRIELFHDNDNAGFSGRYIWARMCSNDALPYTYPLGLDLLIDNSSPRPEEWSVRRIRFDNKEYNSFTSLLDQFTQSQEAEKDFPRDFQLDEDIKPKQGPKLIEPEGKRYAIHGQRVVYSNWNFFYQMSPSQGLKIFNVAFNNNRIIYEVSLQQILSPNARYVSPQLFGESVQELVRGVDCPDTAVYLDTTIFVNGGRPKTTPNSICVFENNAGTPYRRHVQRDTDGVFVSYFGAEDYYLVVRSIATVGLEDHVLDYIFRSSGEVEVKVSTTGSLSVSLSNDNLFTNPSWSSESLNSHVFVFKVDIDINGTANRISQINYEGDATSSGTAAPRLTLTAVTSETMNSRLRSTKPQSFFVYNANTAGKYGQAKAFAIINNSPADGLLRSPSAPGFFTLYKDAEANVDAHLRNKGQNQSPMQFMFSNNDGLTDRDLVAWVTISSSSMASMEDIPLSSTVQKTCSFSLVPHNYFEESATMRSQDNVWIHPSTSGRKDIVIETFGRSLKTVCFHKSVGPFGYSGNPKQ